MRTKEQILDESQRQEKKTPTWDYSASVNERLTIEVLIDIRDILEHILSSLEALDRSEVK